MAIVAIQLHRTIRPAQVVFQVYRVIQLDRAGIHATRTQRREFRMTAVEACDVSSELCCSTGTVQVRVALRAAYVRGDGQARVSAMFYVARGASGRENLI